MQNSRQPTFQDSPHPRALSSLKSPHPRVLPSLKSTHPRALCGLESPHPRALPGLKCCCFFIFSFYPRPTQWVPQNMLLLGNYCWCLPLHNNALQAWNHWMGSIGWVVEWSYSMATSNQFELNLLTLVFPFSLMLSPIILKNSFWTKSLGNCGTFFIFLV